MAKKVSIGGRFNYKCAKVRRFNLHLFGWRFGVSSNGSKWAQSLTYLKLARVALKTKNRKTCFAKPGARRNETKPKSTRGAGACLNSKRNRNETSGSLVRFRPRFANRNIMLGNLQITEKCTNQRRNRCFGEAIAVSAKPSLS